MPTKSGVTFWWLPEEESAFIQLLGGLGKPIAFHNRWFTERGQVAPQNLQEFIGVEEPSVLLFGFTEDQSGIQVEQQVFDSVEHFAVTVSRSCVLMYTRGRIRDGKLTQSNLSVCFDYADEQMHSVRKDENFNARAKRILAWVRKKTPHWHQYKSYRVSARAKVQIDSGQQQVSLY
jgi:hypothetical protein